MQVPNFLTCSGCKMIYLWPEDRIPKATLNGLVLCEMCEGKLVSRLESTQHSLTAE